MGSSAYKVTGAAFLTLLVMLILATGAFAAPTNEIVIPAGDVATLSNATFGDNIINPGNCPADRLEYGYELNANPNVQLDSGVGCEPANGATIGPVSAPTQLRVYLDDFTCGDGYVFYSDGGHGLVSPVTPGTWTVSIMDSDLCMSLPTDVRQPVAPGTGNFNVTLTLTPETGGAICATTTQLVTGSTAYLAGSSVSRGTANMLVSNACSSIEQAGSAQGVRGMLLIAQFDRSIAGLVAGGWLSSTQGSYLTAAASTI